MSYRTIGFVIITFVGVLWFASDLYFKSGEAKGFQLGDTMAKLVLGLLLLFGFFLFAAGSD